MGTRRVVARFHSMEEAGGFESPQLYWCITHQPADAYREAQPCQGGYAGVSPVIRSQTLLVELL